METSEQIDMCTSFLEPPAVLMLTVDYIYLEKKIITLRFLLTITNNFIIIFFNFCDVLLFHFTYPSFMVFPDASGTPNSSSGL